jgi:hypothetical protein
VVFGTGCKISDSGKSSKFEVSSMLLISIGIAAGRSLMCPQSIPSKKGWSFISSTPLFPILFSESTQNLEQGNRSRIQVTSKVIFLFTEVNFIYCRKNGRK